MTFLEQRLELGLNFGATYGPRFNTAIATSANGVEQRRAIWSQPLITVQLGDRRVNQSELNYLLDFHVSVKGAFAGFRLRDWSDYKSGWTAIGTGNGTAQSWQLVKRYTVEGVTVTRPITKPIDGTLKVFVGGVETLTGWSCNYTTGVLSTELTGAIAVTFDFDIPVRFEQDKIDFTYEGGKGTRKLFTLAPLTCVELRLEPAIYPTLDVLPTEINEVFDLGYDFGTLGGPSFNTAIATNAAEFESRKSYWENAKGSWDVGDRGLLRSELDYFIALFRCARGMAVPFYFKDWQDEQTKLVRFAEDRISFRFDAFRSSDEEVIFNLGGVAIQETLPIPSPQCFPSTTILNDSFNSSFSWDLVQTDYTGSNNSSNSSVSTTFDSSGFVKIRLDYGNVAASPPSGIRGYWTSDLFYVPLSNDEIIRLNFSVDRIGVDKSPNVSYSPAVYFYTVISGVITIYETSSTVDGTWSTATLNNQLVSNAVIGVPIYFGIAHGAGTNDASAFDPLHQTIGFDNYSVTVNVTCP